MFFICGRSAMSSFKHGVSAESAAGDCWGRVYRARGCGGRGEDRIECGGLEGAPRVLTRVTSPEMSAFSERFHKGEGVDIRTGIAVTGFRAAANTVSVGAVESGADLRAAIAGVGAALVLLRPV
jgi:hypothetical protein